MDKNNIANTNATVVEKVGFKVSKIMLWPSRKVNIGNYNTVDLNAGLEIVFDTPVDIKSTELSEALMAGRKVIHEEFKRQYAPYKK